MYDEEEIDSLVTGMAITDKFFDKTEDEKGKFFHDAFAYFFYEGIECIEEPGIYEFRLQVIKKK